MTTGADDPVAALVGRIDYPMYVVTASGGGTVSGCLAGFVTQCSIEPVHFLVCVSNENHTAGVAEQARTLAVHLLGADQYDTAAFFGELTGDAIDKMALVTWRAGTTGAPVLAECAAWFEADVLDRVPMGDHTGYVVAPVAGDGGTHPGRLMYSAVRHLHAGHPPGER